MKHGKRLLRVHKEILKAKGLDPENYLYIKDTPEQIQFINIYTSELIFHNRKED